MGSLGWEDTEFTGRGSGGRVDGRGRSAGLDPPEHLGGKYFLCSNGSGPIAMATTPTQPTAKTYLNPLVRGCMITRAAGNVHPRPKSTSCSS